MSKPQSKSTSTITPAPSSSAGASQSPSHSSTPVSTPSPNSEQSGVLFHTRLDSLESRGNMEHEATPQEPAAAADRQDREGPVTTEVKPEAKPEDANEEVKKAAKKKVKCKKHDHDNTKAVKTSGGKKTQKEKAASSESSSEDESEESDSSESSSSEEEAPKKQKKKAKKEKEKEKDKAKAMKKSKGKKDRRKSKQAASESDDEDSTADDDEDADSEAEVDDAPSEKSSTSSKFSLLEQQFAALKRQILSGQKKTKAKKASTKPAKKSKEKDGSKSSFSTKYKKVDELWSNETHQYELRESSGKDDSEFAEFAFLVRRTFDWENKYRDTVIDIKSKQLRAALTDVMKDCKSVSLEAEEPTVDPNVLFMYLEELRTHYKKTLKAKIKEEKKKKVVKKLEQQRQLVKTLVGYLDEDYAEIKKRLYPLLNAGQITFDLMPFLHHPNEVAVTSTYGSWEEPRCFKVEYVNKCCTMARGEWYCIEGRYLEYDGKSFGYGDFEVDVEAFKGPRKITSLATYPLKYHPNEEAIRKQIIERGEKFINLEGMHYKLHKGMAFHKKKKQVLKINVNGRVMLDPATFRRVNPNYPISWTTPKDDDDDLFDLGGDDDSDDGSCCCGGSDSDDEPAMDNNRRELDKAGSDDHKPKYKYKYETNARGQAVFVRVEVDEDGTPIPQEHVDKMTEAADGRNHIFTKDELLLTSSVILGFAFSEKLWLEFTISGIQDIKYNESAFESLVLPPNQKSIVRALVESHKSHGAKTIDDVVQGKGKGLVAVLHGPPGTGKTLTAEGISELLKCPLYMVSAGELGTDPGRLEHQLLQILDIAHTWGAVLLLDEADVFLEKREVHDIHRNALVSIFLRLLEYFQGILFLTTNRVETFDDAFQSRIHVALRYGELTHKAKKSIWKMFLEMVRQVDGMEVAAISEGEIDVLARNQLNGRQIKNLVRTAQALALNEKEMLTMGHIRRVIEVAETFDRDLRGGTGYIDAMRSYT